MVIIRYKILRWEIRALSVILLIVMLTATGYAQEKQIPRWSVYEIELHAKANYDNPYLESGVTAVFIGPGEIEKKVQGFWDGGDTFRIRFTPTVLGTWHYRTSSKDNGLNNKQALLLV